MLKNNIFIYPAKIFLGTDEFTCQNTKLTVDFHETRRPGRW